VHFLRFEFAAAMIAAARTGAALAAGVDHPAYRHSVDPLPAALRRELLADFA
jgi:superfamily II helicase